MNVYEGSLVATGLRFGVVVARFNSLITEQLLAGAVDALRRHGADEAAIDVYRCPGTFELPALLRRVAASGRYDAVLALGAVIRGGTPHFDYVCSAATDGLSRVALQTGAAIGFGLLTCDTEEQALDRAGLDGSSEDKGYEAAAAALSTAMTLRNVRRGYEMDGSS
jgi:6,7-dimethyl-8-ribityllumazine synthase